MATAAIIGGALVVGSTIATAISARKQAKAIERAALSQQAAAGEALDFEKETRDLARAEAAPSADELASIDRLLELREVSLNKSLAALDRQQELLDAVDPALKEAGVQALQLLQGKEAAALAPIRGQRDQQRRDLENQLASQLGSGFRTSSAGMEALSRFDAATDAVLFDAQQTTLGQLLGTAAAVRPQQLSDIATFSQIVGGTDRAILSAQQNQAARRVSAITGTPVNFQNLIATAGAGEAGNLARAKAQQQLFAGLGSFGGQLLGAGVGDIASQRKQARSTGGVGQTGNFGTIAGVPRN